MGSAGFVMPRGRFPRTRMRRNRNNAWSRSLVAENRVSVADLIWPVFVIEGENRREQVAVDARRRTAVGGPSR